jgi:anti-sigma regulatory factor (Ser/Thr protein kinase)
LQPHIVPVTDGSQVSEARRLAIALASEIGWDQTASGKLAIVATEAATNLVKHAQLGEIHLGTCRRDGHFGIEVLALDRGPGVARIEECLRDGYSTQATAGTGLGAIARLADEFDVYSQPGKGTCIVARIYASPDSRRPSSPDLFTVGAVQVPVRGERQCGDNWGLREENGQVVLMVADGLGHGPEANQASTEAIAVLMRSTDLAPLVLLERVHHALRATRGAAVAVAHIEIQQKQVRFAGVGNIAASIITPEATQHLVSHNGTAGHNVHRLQEFAYAWPTTGTLVMHSDGITTSWHLDPYPGLTERHPSLLAAVLYRDASRGRDDACVVVARPARKSA